MTPYAATPFSPEYFISWELNKIATILMDMFVINSESPLEVALINTFPSNFVFPSLNILEFFLRK